MKDKLYVNTNNLETIAKSLRNRDSAIKSIYKNQVKVLLEESKDAIKVSGVDFSDIDAQFNQAFMNLSSNLNELSNILINNILPKYNDLSLAIKSAFNDKFASEMNNILTSIKNN